MLLETILPQLPTNTIQTVIYVVAVLGVVLVVYSQFVEMENRRDLIRLVGAGALFVYALFIFNLVFMLVSAGIFLAALAEFIEILLGPHVHHHLEIKIK